MSSHDDYVDNVVKRSTITFPLLITGPEIELLFCYLRQEARLNTKYSLTEHKNVGNDFQERREREATVLNGYELTGTMFLNSDSSSFTALRGFGNDGITYLSALQFFIIPGYGLEEHRKEEVALWDTAREYVAKYFQLRRPRSSPE